MTTHAPDQPLKNARQEAFALAYVRLRNQERAAIEAGYSVRNARNTASLLMRTPAVRDRIRALQAAAAEEAALNLAELYGALRPVLNSDVRHFRVNHETGRFELAPDAPEDAWKAVASVKHSMTKDLQGRTHHEAEIKLWSKTEASRQVGDILGAFKKAPQTNLNVDVAQLSDGQLERLANGEPLEAVLAGER